MLTRRGFWLLAAALSTLSPAVLFGSPNAALLALSLLAWFAVAWVRFAIEARLLAPRLRLQRLLDRRPVGRQSLIPDRPVQIEVQLLSPLSHELSRITLADRLPKACAVKGKATVVGQVSAGEPLIVRYSLTPLQPGAIRFEGASVELTERHGLFRHRFFLRQPVEATVLPGIVIEKDLAPGLKSRNVLPIHGVHRHRRPGSGSELLDLRDYVPGDPPKTIAWKVSARRDRLVTKEYESEVPVRCLLFVDASDSAKLAASEGGGLTRSARIAASLAGRMIANRDPVGLCVFDRQSAQLLAPAANRRHFSRILRTLSEAIASPPAPKPCAPQPPFGAAFRLAEQVYPELMTAATQWPGAWYKRYSLPSFPWYAYAFSFAGIAALVYLGVTATPDDLGWSSLSALLIFGLVMLLLFFASRATKKKHEPLPMTYRRRKQLASVLAAWASEGPGEAASLVADDRYLSERCQQFCHAHREPVPVPLTSQAGEYLWREPEKLQVLSQRLLRSAASGKDNELYVLFVDLLDVVDDAKTLFRTIKAVQARRHQAMVVCPWPEGVAPPDSPEQLEHQQILDEMLKKPSDDPALTLFAHERSRYRSAYSHLKEQLRQSRTPLVCAPETDAIKQVLDRIERMRVGQTAVAYPNRRR